MDVQAIADNYWDTISNHYLDMRGRVGRGQFWWFVLANFIASLLAHALGHAVRLPLGQLYNLAVLLPSMSLGARRLQDVGRNGQPVWIPLLLIAVTQIIGIFMELTFFLTGFFGFIFAPGLALGGVLILACAIVLLIFWIQQGDPGPNAYGPPPPVFDPSRPASYPRG